MIPTKRIESYSILARTPASKTASGTGRASNSSNTSDTNTTSNTIVIILDIIVIVAK